MRWGGVDGCASLSSIAHKPIVLVMNSQYIGNKESTLPVRGFDYVYIQKCEPSFMLHLHILRHQYANCVDTHMQCHTSHVHVELSSSASSPIETQGEHSSRDQDVQSAPSTSKPLEPPSISVPLHLASQEVSSSHMTRPCAHVDGDVLITAWTSFLTITTWYYVASIMSRKLWAIVFWQTVTIMTTWYRRCSWNRLLQRLSHWIPHQPRLPRSLQLVKRAPMFSQLLTHPRQLLWTKKRTILQRCA